MNKKLIILGVTLLCAALLFAGCAKNGGQSGAKKTDPKFPDKPVTLIVPLGAGGSTDLLARAIANVAPKYLGQPIVIVNKPGGSTNVGMAELVKSKPDGYTIGAINNGVVVQPLLGNTKINYADELVSLGQAAIAPQVLAVSADSPWTTLEEFVQYAKENPGKIKYGNVGTGTSTHIALEQFANAAGIKMSAISFEGGSQAITALLGGHIQVTSQSPVDFKEQIKAGKLRALAVAGNTRLDDPVFKDVPTFKEKGYNFSQILWQGFAAPKGLPDDVRQKLVKAFEQMLNDPEVKKATNELGLTFEFADADTFKNTWITSQADYKKILTETGIMDQIKNQKK